MAKKINKTKDAPVAPETVATIPTVENRVARPTPGKNDVPSERAIPAERTVYLVNPAGAIHDCTLEHARERMRTVGWRKATDAEIAELKKRKGLQVFDDPICKPFSPDVEEE